VGAVAGAGGGSGGVAAGGGVAAEGVVRVDAEPLPILPQVLLLRLLPRADGARERRARGRMWAPSAKLASWLKAKAVSRPI
jgi:hypothetical protein